MQDYSPSREEKRMVKSLNKKISSIRSVEDIEEIQDEYSIYNSPYPNQYLAHAYLMFDHDRKAMKSFVKSASPWLEVPNRYWNSQFSVSVGSSLSEIINRCKMCDVEDNIAKKVYALSFSFLSRSMEIIRNSEGGAMMESLFNRGVVSGQNKNNFLRLVQKYVGYGKMTKVMSFSDFYLSRLEYLRYGDKEGAATAYKNAKKEKDWLEDLSVAGKEANRYTEKELAEIGKSRNEKMYESMKEDILDGEYNIGQDEFEKAIYSVIDV